MVGRESFETFFESFERSPQSRAGIQRKPDVRCYRTVKFEFHRQGKSVGCFLKFLSWIFQGIFVIDGTAQVSVVQGGGHTEVLAKIVGEFQSRLPAAFTQVVSVFVALVVSENRRLRPFHFRQIAEVESVEELILENRMIFPFSRFPVA